MSERKRITIVTSAYNEAECVDELARRLQAVFASLPQYDFDVVAVENGSSDDTFGRLQAIHEADPRFAVVQLARNFRMDGGLTAGLDFARGDAVVLMAADLQDRPEDIPTLVARWEEGFENVYGVVTARHGTGPLRRLNSRLFYWVMGRLSERDVPANASDFRLLDRRVVDQLRRLEERNRFLRGLVAWVGFSSVGVPIERPERFAGSSKAYSLQVVELAVRGILAHSMRPIVMMPVVGFGLVVASFAALVALALDWLVAGVPFPGFGTIVALVVLLFGILVCFLSVIGFYVGLIYEEVRGRPNYVPRRTLGTVPLARPGAPEGAAPRAATSWAGGNGTAGHPPGGRASGGAAVADGS
ncbi:MAG: glycosyltransferase family 2 protein [Actinomycetota bacterium]|nr:glycosyltransferase family 2 protein [Actinomycetota bacterium]